MALAEYTAQQRLVDSDASGRPVRVAVEGCCHGELPAIYAAVARESAAGPAPVDLLVVCGDFQAVRNAADLDAMAVPDKYKQLGSFWEYYTGRRRAPVLTVVIGGNHEASSYLWELHHGGWLAPNIYYLGAAGCVTFRGLRIAGSSGIYKSHDYEIGYPERPPFTDAGAVRSIYHTRRMNTWRLAQLAASTRGADGRPPSPIDLMLSHDWPARITDHGDAAALIRRKPFFRDEIHAGSLGSPPQRMLLDTLRPRHWFSAHLHCFFEAHVVHATAAATAATEALATETPATAPAATEAPAPSVVADLHPHGITVATDAATDSEHAPEAPAEAPMVKSPPSGALRSPERPSRPSRHRSSDGDASDDALAGEDADVFAAAPRDPPPAAADTTHFVALDKCLPRRRFLHVTSIPPRPGAPAGPLSHDREWLAVLAASHALLAPFCPPAHRGARFVPPDLAAWAVLLDRARDDVLARLPDAAHLAIDPAAWVPTAPGGPDALPRGARLTTYTNPQHTALLAMLGLAPWPAHAGAGKGAAPTAAKRAGPPGDLSPSGASKRPVAAWPSRPRAVPGGPAPPAVAVRALPMLTPPVHTDEIDLFGDE